VVNASGDWKAPNDPVASQLEPAARQAPSLVVRYDAWLHCVW